MVAIVVTVTYKQEGVVFAPEESLEILLELTDKEAKDLKTKNVRTTFVENEKEYSLTLKRVRKEVELDERYTDNLVDVTAVWEYHPAE